MKPLEYHIYQGIYLDFSLPGNCRPNVEVICLSVLQFGTPFHTLYQANEAYNCAHIVTAAHPASRVHGTEDVCAVSGEPPRDVHARCCIIIMRLVYLADLVARHHATVYEVSVRDLDDCRSIPRCRTT